MALLLSQLQEQGAWGLTCFPQVNRGRFRGTLAASRERGNWLWEWEGLLYNFPQSFLAGMGTRV